MELKTEQIKELIKRRRRQVLVHSYIYYILNDNIISDKQWSEWALELETLQNTYPELSSEVELYQTFKSFDHSTGANLDYSLPECDWVDGKALYLIRYIYEHRGK